MAVPQYCHSRQGRVYRILRSSQPIACGGRRYTLRAVPIRPDAEPFEASCEVQADLVRDKVRHGQVIPTPEVVFESLWQQLRLDVDAP
jgi:hypothetical protein